MIIKDLKHTIMSTFGGLMVEYQHIAIDRFQGPAVLRARAYFLSHAHMDHMVGLDSSQFSQRLRISKHVKLYCSEVTHEFLLTDSRFIHLEPFIMSLPIEEPMTITLHKEIDGKEDQVLVTLLAAGHCPGSVMFLFEGDQGNVLYTGDFRFAKGEAVRMLPLHSGNRVKDIKSMYVDTTFCVPQAMYIPSREQSRDALLDLVEKQIVKSPTHMVRLACKAKYGYEYLFVEISRELNLKVHVSPMVMAQYERVPDLAKHLTTDGRSTQVHACRYVDCSMHNATDVLVVVPSTMWFTSNARPSDVLKKVGHRHRLCFSFHSSFSEVRDFVGYIRPVNIYANVIPYNCTEEMINERLQDLRRGADKTASVSETLTYKPLGQLKKSARTLMRNMAASCAYDDNETVDALFESSPPPVKKRKKDKLQEERLPDGAPKRSMYVSQESGDYVEDCSQSYLAMDDSDLSSGELDLYDSAPDLGQSQLLKGSREGATESKLGTEDFVEASWMDCAPHLVSHMLQDSPGKQGVDSDISERRKGVGLSEKQSQQESKQAEIDSWLRYLPNAGCGVIELNSSQEESDKTEDYSIKNRQEMSIPYEDGLPGNRSGAEVKIEEHYCKFDQCSGSLVGKNSTAHEHSNGDCNTALRVRKTPPNESTKRGKFTLVDHADNIWPEQHQDILSVTSHDPVHKIIKSESHLKVSVEPKVQLVKLNQGATVKQGDEKTEQPTDTNQSHDHILKNIIKSGSHGMANPSSQALSVKPKVQYSKHYPEATVKPDEEYTPHSKDADQSHDPINIIKSESLHKVALSSQAPFANPVVQPSKLSQGATVKHKENTRYPKDSIHSPSQKIIHKNVIKSEPHGTVALSSQASSARSAVPQSLQGTGETQVTDELSEPSQGTSQSQDTFLPSSQGSVASRSSSDFDIPCTPEGNGLQLDRVEAVQVMIARGESISLASCKRTIQLD